MLTDTIYNNKNSGNVFSQHVYIVTYFDKD